VVRDLNIASQRKGKIILLADDDESEHILLEAARELANLSVDIEFRFVTDGRQAIDYLAGNPPFDDRGRFPLPDLMLLDLKMPGLDGFDVLEWVLNQPKLSEMPVIVRTGSFSDADRKRAMLLGARDYYTKMVGLPSDVSLLQEIVEKWLTKPEKK
jgi:CheY-like chemotaxis protein